MYRILDAQQKKVLEEHLKSRYFSKNIWGSANYEASSYLSTERGRGELHDLLDGRIESFRRQIVPWLSSLLAMKDARILEIGCGTGASTVALAEQGASVTGIDIDPDSLWLAQERCRLHEVDAKFLVCNAQDASKLMADQQFDCVIFFACLEHMTHDERQLAIRSIWDSLNPGTLLAVIETPNRLWWFDGHSSFLPFFHWLPDDVALQYAQHSPREPYNSAFKPGDPEDEMHFLRQGRGVSFHDFELALGRLDAIDVVSSLFEYQVKRNPLLRMGFHLTRHGRFHRMLRSFRGDLNDAFFHSSLDFIMRR